MEERWRIPTEYRMEMEGWYWKRLKCDGFGRIIMRICII